MGDGGGDIIIKGGSVELDYDDTLYPKKPGDPKKHTNSNRKITKVVVEDETGAEIYNSGDSQNGMKWTITISTRA